jgi:hypothetical protein
MLEENGLGYILGDFFTSSSGHPVCIRAARFLSVQHTKTGKNIPNDNKIYQMAIKYFQWP